MRRTVGCRHLRGPGFLFQALKRLRRSDRFSKMYYMGAFGGEAAVRDVGTCIRWAINGRAD